MDDQAPLLPHNSRLSQRTHLQQFMRIFANLSIADLIRLTGYRLSFGQWLPSQRLPMSGETARRLNQLLQNLSDGSQLVTDFIWAPTLFIAMMRDIHLYYAQPEQRFDVTMNQILSGMASGEGGMSFSSQWGDNLPTDPNYFTGAAFFFSAWIGAMAAYTIARRHWHTIEPGIPVHAISPAQTAAWLMHDLDNANNLVDFESFLNRILDSKNAFPLYRQRLVADLVRQLDGSAIQRLHSPNANAYAGIRCDALSALESSTTPRHSIRGWARIPAWISAIHARYELWRAEGRVGWQLPFNAAIVTYVYYARARLFQLFTTKLAGAIHNAEQACTCHDDRKVWEYVRMAAEDLCSVCGDWSFVDERHIQDAQSCIDGLMQAVHSPSILARGFERLRSFDLDVMNMTDQAWPTWQPDALSEFLNSAFQMAKGQLAALDLSAANPVQAVADTLVQQWSTFLASTPVDELVVNAVQFSSTQWDLLSGAANALTSMTIRQAALDDSDLAAIVMNNLTQAMHSITLAGNQVSDYGVGIVLAHLGAAIRYLDFSDNQLLMNAYQPWINALNNSMLATLRLDGNAVNETAMAGIFATLPQISINVLGLSRMALSDQSMMVLGQRLARSAITQLDVSYNNAGPQGLVALAQGAVNSTLEVLNYAGNQVDGNSLSVLFNQLNATSIRSIRLAAASIAPSTWQAVSTISIAHAIDFDLSSITLRPNDVQAMVTWLQSGYLKLASLNLRNTALSSESLTQLIAALPDTMTALDISGNPLSETGFSALQQWIARAAGLIELHLENVNLLPGQALSLVNQLIGTGVRSLMIGLNQIGDIVPQLAAQLLSPDHLPHRTDIANEQLSRDVVAEFNQHAQPATALQTLGVQGTNLTTAGARALCRLQDFLPDFSHVHWEQNGLSVSDLSQCVFRMSHEAANTSPAIHPTANSGCDEHRDIGLVSGFATLMMMLLALLVAWQAAPRLRRSVHGLFGSHRNAESGRITADEQGQQEITL